MRRHSSWCAVHSSVRAGVYFWSARRVSTDAKHNIPEIRHAPELALLLSRGVRSSRYAADGRYISFTLSSSPLALQPRSLASFQSRLGGALTT